MLMGPHTFNAFLKSIFSVNKSCASTLQSLSFSSVRWEGIHLQDDPIVI